MKIISMVRESQKDLMILQNHIGKMTITKIQKNQSYNKDIRIMNLKKEITNMKDSVYSNEDIINNVLGSKKY